MSNVDGVYTRRAAWSAARAMVLGAGLGLSASLFLGSALAGCKSSAPLVIDPHPEARLTAEEADLLRAASRGERSRVIRLLDAGVNINVRDAGGRSPLYYAAAGGHKQLTAALLGRLAEPSAADTNPGWTPLHAAVTGGHEETVDVLLAFGVEVNVQDTAGNTPLHIAAARGHDTITRALISRSADRTIPNRDGMTPADIADPRKTGHFLRTPTLGESN